MADAEVSVSEEENNRWCELIIHKPTNNIQNKEGIKKE